SSNAADEATHPVAGTGGNYTSTQLVVWALTNTSSLNTATPNVKLSNTVLGVNQYALPGKQRQPGSGTPATRATPQGYCINDTTIDVLGGVGAWSDVSGGVGAAPDDGFTSYKAQVGNPPRTRWGDYGAAAVDGSSIWIASEYIAHACDYTTWGGRFFGASSGDNKLGTCAPS